jgi:hypothetical protein
MDGCVTLSMLKKYGTDEDGVELYEDSGDRVLYALDVHLDKDAMVRIEYMYEA